MLCFWSSFSVLFFPAASGWVNSDHEPLTHKYQIQPEVKMPVSSSRRQPQQTRWSHSPNPSISPKTNYPGVRDLTHKFRTAGDSLTLITHQCWFPQNNLQCLSRAPALFKVFIDPALALRCHPVLSVSDCQLSLSLALLKEAGKQASGGLGRTEESGRVMISS